MQTEEITIRVDSQAAQAYRAAPDEERRKLDLLLSLRLQDALEPNGLLQDLMRKIGSDDRIRCVVDVLQRIKFAGRDAHIHRRGTVRSDSEPAEHRGRAER